MDENVEAAPNLLDLLEQGILVLVLGHVEPHDDRGVDAFGQGAHVRFGLLVEIGDRQFRAGPVKRLGHAPGDRLIVGDADDERALVR
jgi:hypothetical protein